jgi:hypothetical protein
MEKAMKRQVAAIVDHGFHRKTGSFTFIDELLQEKYAVVRLYDDSYGAGGGPAVTVEDINACSPDLVIYCQCIHSPEAIRRIRCNRISWLPMWDSESGRSLGRWLAYRSTGINVVCMCSFLQRKLTALGFDSHYVQYFKKPERRGLPAVRAHGYTAFFWNRTQDVSWEHIRRLVNPRQIRKLYFKNDPDPGQPAITPGPDDIRDYHIAMLEGWQSGETMRHVIHDIDLFFCPRKSEGIGMSFLDAFAAGVCLAGVDAPTMNEYIEPGKTGFLFDPHHLKELNLDRIPQMRGSVCAAATRGYRRFAQSQPALLAALERRNVASRPVRWHSKLLATLKGRILGV